MSGILQQLRWFTQEAGLRVLMRRKSACAVAVITLALAVGANTAAFSMLRTFLIASIGIPDADRVVVVAPLRELPGRGAVLFFEAYPNYELLEQDRRGFEHIGVTVQGAVSWTDRDESRPLQFARVSASFFPTMQVFPVVGRAFERKEEGPSPAPVAIISHALWSSAMAQDSAVIGRTMLINGEPVTVVGVMPRGFAQPAPTDIWLPFDIPAQMRVNVNGARQLTVFGRLAPDVSERDVVALASALTTRAEELSAGNKDFRYEFRPIRTVLLDSARLSILLVQAGAALLLVLAVLNLASLLVAWGFDRQQEMAVRQALGARRARVTRMLFLQSVIVVGSGAVLGVLLAWAALPWIRRLQINPQLTYFMQRIELDATVLIVSIAIAGIAAVAAGVLPAWFNRNIDLVDGLRSGSRGASLSPAALRWQQGIVVVQASLSVVILSVAALVMISSAKAGRIPLGIEPKSTMVARLQFPSTATHAERAALMAALERKLSSDPAIASFGSTSTLPVSDIVTGGRFVPDVAGAAADDEPQLLHFRRVTTGYMKTVGIAVVRGRGFDAHDDSSGRSVAIVSQAFAEKSWPGEDPIGKTIFRIVPTGREPLEIVGVAANVMDAGNRSPAGETVYVPWARISHSRLSVVLEPRSTRAAAVAAFRRALGEVNPTMAVMEVASLRALVERSDTLPRLQSLLLLLFAVVSIGIAAIGSYGVASQLFANREREYALRMVFGASAAELRWSVLSGIGKLTIPGTIIGLLLMLSIGDSISAFVFGIAPNSALVLGLVAGGMLALAAVSSLPLALRAARIDVRGAMGGG